MGLECKESHIADACIFSNGLVVRTAGEYFQLWAKLSLFDENEEPFQLKDPELERPPVCLTAIDPIKISNNYQNYGKNQSNNPNSSGSDLHQMDRMSQRNIIDLVCFYSILSVFSIFFFFFLVFVVYE